MMPQLLVTLLSAINPKTHFYPFIMVLIMSYMAYQVQEIKVEIAASNHAATTNYAFNVIKYGLEDASTDAEVIALVKQWNDLKWGAQIGAIHTLCNEQPNRLVSLVRPETATTLCRLTK